MEDVNSAKRKRNAEDAKQSPKRRKTLENSAAEGEQFSSLLSGKSDRTELERKIDDLKLTNLELTKERDEARIEVDTLKDERTNMQLKHDEDRKRYLEKLKYVQSKEKEVQEELSKLKEARSHESEKTGKDVQVAHEKLSEKIKEVERVRVENRREVNSAHARVEEMKHKLENQSNVINQLKLQLQRAKDGEEVEGGVKDETGKHKVTVKDEVIGVKKLMMDLLETKSTGDAGRIDPKLTEDAAEKSALQRENRELKAKLDTEKQETETKWSLMEMANSERVKSKEMETKLARLIELEEKIEPLQKEIQRWHHFLENSLTGCETITQAEVRLNEILQESLENLKSISELQAKLKALTVQHQKLKDLYNNKLKEAQSNQQKLNIVQGELKTTRRDREYFKHMHAHYLSILNDFDQVKNPDLNSMHSRRLKALTKEVEVLKKRLQERTNEKLQAEEALIKAKNGV